MDEHRLLLTIIIPACNEEENLEPTVEELEKTLASELVPHEILIVDDNSVDGTRASADRLAAHFPTVRVISRTRLGGFGRAVRAGLGEFRGDVVALVMADQSDSPRDVVRCYRKIEEGYDCVFGSRFRSGTRVTNYPRRKLVVNRLVNKLLQILFWTRFNDLTNAFKMYRREVVLECGPYSSSHFNITIELSLSALIHRYHIAEIPIDWAGRTWGASSLSIRQMGRRYLSVLLKLFFEKMLIGDDILDERLLENEQTRSFERRLSRVESALIDSRKSSDEETDIVD